MQTKLEEQINLKLNSIEEEIKTLHKTILFGNVKMKKPVSFRGIAKTNLTEDQLDEAIDEAKKSLFPHKEF